MVSARVLLNFFNLLTDIQLYPSFSGIFTWHWKSNLGLNWRESRTSACIWGDRARDLETHTCADRNTFSFLFPTLFFSVIEWKGWFFKVMNTCLHYISKSVYKYFCFEIVIKIPFFLNTIFQTTCESRFIKWHYPASHWSEYHPLTQRSVLPKMCLLSSCRWGIHEHRHLHTLMVFSKRITLHIFSILCFPLDMNSQDSYLHLINAWGFGIFWHV